MNVPAALISPKSIDLIRMENGWSSIPADNFSDLVLALARLSWRINTYATKGTYYADGGVDIFSGNLKLALYETANSIPLDVLMQLKHTESEKYLQSSGEEDLHKILGRVNTKLWVLAFPFKPSTKIFDWFGDLQKQYQTDTFKLELWGEAELKPRIAELAVKSYPTYAAFCPPGYTVPCSMSNIVRPTSLKPSAALLPPKPLSQYLQHRKWTDSNIGGILVPKRYDISGTQY